MSKKYEEFPISEELVREFIKINREYWSDAKPNGKYIYLNFSMVRMQIGWIVPKLLYAKGMAEKSGAQVIVLTWHDNALLSEFIESFGMIHISLDKICNSNIFSMFKAAFKTIGFILSDGTGEGLKKLKSKSLGFNVGKPIYEDILRTSNVSTVKSCKNKNALKKIFHILWVLYALEKQCKKNPVICGITDDMAYHEGLFIKLFLSLGAKDYASSNIGETKVYLEKDGEVVRYYSLQRRKYRTIIDKLGDKEVEVSDKYLVDRFSGKNGNEIDKVAFAGKVLSREELSEKLGLDSKKKNIIIMCHTFSDAVFAHRCDFYRDYYDWVENTLAIAENVTDVNWILKPHPSRHIYNEAVDTIEAMYERHKKPHISMLNDDVSTASIKDIADVMVTIGGSAGCEFSCFGIPTVIIGKPNYQGFGFTIEPKTKEDYEKQLREINSLGRLDEEQIKMAKKVFYLINNKDERIYGRDDIEYDDEFSKGINDLYLGMNRAISKEYFVSNSGTNSYNESTLKYIIDFMNKNDLKETNYYKKGCQRGSEL